ncbi:MAG: D-alanine--D-alanine ligase [Deltaproteobacteria bacterium]|nr:MAG: D-alanine--D-alanine ligase [Deltaproteobacteria bacterium]
MFKDKKIGVLMGGTSAEREVSLNSGRAILKALWDKGYQAIGLDAKKDIGLRLVKEGINVAFIALHGRYGEDGSIQGLLEILRIPYTGSGILASALSMNKLASRQLFEIHNLPTPRYHLLQEEDANRFKSSDLPFPLPAVVKPCGEGSSVGISIVSKSREWKAALEEAFRYDCEILIEQYIAGKEVHIGILQDRVLGGVEIVPKDKFYSYRAKYTKGQSDYILPPRLSPRILKKAERIALKAHKCLGCQGATRADLRVDPRGRPYLLEVNSLPGMTATSLLPKIARESGLNYNDLVERILQTASLKIRVPEQKVRQRRKG